MHTGQMPYSGLFVRPTKTVALSANGHITVLDSSTGTILHSTSDCKENIEKSGQLLCANVDDAFKNLVVAAADKCVRVWEIDGLNIVSEREAPKKPTDICFTKDGQKILVSDKFGDVHSFPLHVPDDQAKSAEASTSEKSNVARGAKRTNDGSLVMGHVSLLTTFILTPDEKYIITADRDEHIRVSWYPEAYNIERFCLGHKKFVSAINIPPWDSTLLISGGGDPILKIWNWIEGKVLREIKIVDAAMPFVKVVREKPRSSEGNSDAEGDEGTTKMNARQRRKANRKKGRGKGKGKEEMEAGQGAEGEDRQDNMDVDDAGGEPKVDKPETAERETDGEGKTSRATALLAVQKIETIEVESSRIVIFSVYGATSLFYCAFPDCSEAPSLSPLPEIRHIELLQPVLDFVYWLTSDELWILLDANWAEEGSPRPDNAKMIKVARIVDGKFTLIDESVCQPLLTALNATNPLLEVSSDELKKLDLYTAMAALPKNVDAEHNAMDDDPASEIVSDKGRQLSNKELGRLKSKKAVSARTAALTGKRVENETTPEDRETKRPKNEGVFE